MKPTLADVVTEARTWIGTRYHHQARLKQVGVDCVGLVIGVARELDLIARDFDVGGYSPTPDGTSLKRGCAEFLDAVSLGDVRPGHVLLLRFRREPQHMAIVADYLHGGLSMIHADGGAATNRVVENRVDEKWRSRVVAAYALRGLAEEVA